MTDEDGRVVVNGLPYVERSDLGTEFIDMPVTGGGHGGLVNLTLGTVVFGGDHTGRLTPACRLRMTAGTARALAMQLTLFADEAEAAADPEGPPANTKLN